MIVLSDRQIVWAPNFTVGDVAVYLNSEFAGACRRCEVGEEVQGVYTERIWELAGLEKDASSGHLSFHANSLLLTGVYSGRNGEWIATSDIYTSPVRYHGHNLKDPTLQVWCVRIFAAWASGAQGKLEWR